jgi:rSAM/selenodomain-associated transferase 2
MKPTLSVIIPCLNEAESLPPLLAQLTSQQGIDLQIIVADGGSTDDTLAYAKAAGASIVHTARGRGRQMNAGAGIATSEWLLLLHADSSIDDPMLLTNALRNLQDHTKARGHRCIAGHFPLKFTRADNCHTLAWRYVEEKTAFNRPYCTNGDQGLLLSRDYFDELGGFDEDLPFLEDQRIAARIHGNGLMITLPSTLHSSARRFEQAGFHRQYLLMALIMAMHAAGLEQFFRQAPGIYRAQQENTRLRLLPFFRLARSCARQSGRLRTWLAIGRLGRENWWQLFYFVDIALRPWLGAGRYPCLRSYERLIEPLTRNRLCDGMAAGVLWLHFYLIVLPWSAWQDHQGN